MSKQSKIQQNKTILVQSPFMPGNEMGLYYKAPEPTRGTVDTALLCTNSVLSMITAVDNTEKIWLNSSATISNPTLQQNN